MYGRHLLVENVTRSQRNSLEKLLFSALGITASFHTSGCFHDTDYRYDCYTDAKLTKAQLVEAIFFAKGVIAALYSIS